MAWSWAQLGATKMILALTDCSSFYRTSVRSGTKGRHTHGSHAKITTGCPPPLRSRLLSARSVVLCFERRFCKQVYQGGSPQVPQALTDVGVEGPLSRRRVVFSVELIRDHIQPGWSSMLCLCIQSRSWIVCLVYMQVCLFAGPKDLLLEVSHPILEDIILYFWLNVLIWNV